MVRQLKTRSWCKTVAKTSTPIHIRQRPGMPGPWMPSRWSCEAHRLGSVYVRPRAHRPCLTTVRSFRHQFLEIDRPERDAARLGLQLIAPTTSPVLSPPPPGGRCAPRRPLVDVQQLRVEIPTSGCTTRPRVQVPPSQGLDPATACNGPPAPWAFRGCSPVLGGWKDPSRQGRTPIPRDGRGRRGSR